MHDPITVAVVDRKEQVLHDDCGLLFREVRICLMRCDLLEQVHSSTVLHDEIDVLRGLVGLIVLANVGMVELGEDLDLLLELLKIVTDLCLLHGLDCYFEVTVNVVIRKKHLPEVPSP